jgi:cytochrome c oxidase subunit 2
MTTKKLHIDPYERGWMIFTAVLLVAFFVTVTIAGYAMGIQLPAPETRVDPAMVDAEGQPWHPDNVGLHEVSPGKYDAYILSQTWLYSPREITVPAGSTVTFYVTSKDVIHGFKIQDTNVNFMVIPGEVSKLSHTFEIPGEYLFICHEYCGAGHAAMFGKVIVEE